MLLDPVQSRALFTHALRHHYAVLAVNADSHACVTDCLEAARQCDAPVIIETSLWQLEGHAYGQGDAVLGLARYLADLHVLAASARYRDVPVVFHTDHIKGPQTLTILSAALQGVCAEFGSTPLALHASTVSLDASSLNDAENVALLCQLADIAHEAGRPATFEMESEVDEGPTPPERTRKLVGAVEAQHPGVVWLYAPALGTQHGLTAGGYPDFRVERVIENVRLLKEITGRDVGLALHGSSGLDEEQLAAAAQAGVVKVNWSSESLLLRSTAARDYFSTHTAELQPQHPRWKATAMDHGLQSHIAQSYVPRVVSRMRRLGGAGQGAAFLRDLVARGVPRPVA